MRRRLVTLFIAILLSSIKSVGFADSCAECKKTCNTNEKTQTCLSEANEAGGFTACGAMVAACIARCSCPDPERVRECVVNATSRHSERASACLREFPTNPTGCMDHNNLIYQGEVARCKASP